MGVQKPRLAVQVSDGFVRCHANGVFGGLNPRGELEMYFTQDIVPIPEAIELDLDKGYARTEHVVPGKPTRLMVASVTIPVDVLPSLMKWMQDKMEDARKRREGPTHGETEQNYAQ